MELPENNGVATEDQPELTEAEELALLEQEIAAEEAEDTAEAEGEVAIDTPVVETADPAIVPAAVAATPAAATSAAPADPAKPTVLPTPAPIPAAETPEAIEALTAEIKANYNFAVNVKPVSFHFKSVKDEATNTVSKRGSIDLLLPIPSVQGIVDILQGQDVAPVEADPENGIEAVAGNKEHTLEMELLMSTIEDVIVSQARALIADDPEIVAGTLDVSKLSWNAIAKIPRTGRAGGIAKEVWEAFAADYQAVMPEATGKEPAKVANAVKILLNKFATIKTAFPVIDLMVQQLAIYMETSKDAALYAQCVSFLVKKADELKNVTEEDLLANL